MKLPLVASIVRDSQADGIGESRIGNVALLQQRAPVQSKMLEQASLQDPKMPLKSDETYDSSRIEGESGKATNLTIARRPSNHSEWQSPWITPHFHFCSCCKELHIVEK